MAANVLGLFFLIIGTTGISNVSSLKEILHRNKRSFYSFPHRDPFNLMKDFRGQSEALCRSKYGPYVCRNIVHDPSYFRHNTNQIENNYPKWQNPYFTYGSIRGWPIDDRSDEVVYDPYASSEEIVSEHDESIQRDVNDIKNLPAFIRALFSPSSSRNPPQSYSSTKSNTPSTSSDGVKFATDLYVPKRLSNDKILPVSIKDSRVTETTLNSEISHIIYRSPVERQQKSSSFMKKENDLIIEGKNTENSSQGGTMETTVNNKDIENTSKFLKNIFMESKAAGNSENRIDGLMFTKSDPITSYPTTSEIKRNSEREFSLKKTSTLRKHLNEPKEENLTESTLFQETTSIIIQEVRPSGEKRSTSGDTEMTNSHDSKILSNLESSSTVFQDPSSFTRAVISLDNKISSSDDIQSTSQKDSKLESTASHSPSSIGIDKENYLKIKSSSPEGIFSASSQNLQTESDISASSFTRTRGSSLFEDKYITAEILEVESTTENSISSNKFTSIIDKVTEDSRKETFSTRSPLKNHLTLEAITQDHIIKISSIRTARIVVTSVFLVIALTALTVLAVFMFRLRRREVEYDQLMLIT